MYLFFLPIALTEELDSISNELHAVNVQIQELLERQQELTQKKNILTNRIKQCLEDSDDGNSSECDSSSPASWNKEGLFYFFFPLLDFFFFSFKMESNYYAWVSLSSSHRGETGHSLSGMRNLSQTILYPCSIVLLN